MRKYGYHRQTSSHIDALAKAGVCFDNYDATDTPGLPSCPALFPGRLGTCTGAPTNDLLFDHEATHSVRMAWLGGLWMVLALEAGRPRPWLWTASQGALTFAVLLAVTTLLERTDWFAGSLRVFHACVLLHLH